MTFGLVAIGILLILSFIGVPIGFALFLVSISGILYLFGYDVMVSMVGSQVFTSISNFNFSVIPLFILMGQLGYHSGLFTEVFEVARKWFGRLPAGLAFSVVAAQTLFGACSGSTVAACAVIGQVAIPVMKKHGYPPTLYTGVVAGSGTLAALIPPSILICIYGIMVDESIGKLLIAGILPGVVTASIYTIMLMIRSRNLARDTERYTLKEKFSSLGYLWVVIILVIAILGGIYTGTCTPTEGGGFGAFVMFMLAVITRRLDRNMVWESVRSTVITTGMILIIIVAAVLFGRLLTLCGFSRGISEWIVALEVPRIVVFGIMVLLFLILGCFVGAAAMMMMTLPVFYPVLLELGYDSIWLGIEVVILCEIALETPPVGVNLYATKSVAGDVSLNTVIRGTFPFIMRDLMALGVIYLFPQIATYLPGKM